MQQSFLQAGVLRDQATPGLSASAQQLRALVKLVALQRTPLYTRSAMQWSKAATRSPTRLRIVNGGRELEADTVNGSVELRKSTS